MLRVLMPLIMAWPILVVTREEKGEKRPLSKMLWPDSHVRPPSPSPPLIPKKPGSDAGGRHATA